MTPEKHAQKLRELAYELIMADAHGHATKACEAGADALDLVATQGAEIARLRTALEEIRTCVTSGCPSCREAATEALLASEVR